MAENEKVTSDKSPGSKAKVAPVAQKPKFDWASLNTLAVVSIASAISGIGALIAIITGHISLAQLKTSGENGRNLALVGVVLGYVQLAGILIFSFLAVIAQVALLTRFGLDAGMWMGPSLLAPGSFGWD